MDPYPKTRKLYLDDPYNVSFQAGLLVCNTIDGRLAAVLDQTYFYPESGGQLSDRGNIAGVEVVDVWEDDAGTVYHQVAENLGAGGVECRIDWDRRFAHMQHHTGQHVLSRAFIEVADLNTVSFHMGTDACTIDLDQPRVADAVIESVEQLANEIVWRDLDVLIRHVDPGEVSDSALRKKIPPGVDTVRLVEIKGFDVIGCCGTHVRRTGELGVIKILRQEKAKGGARISFKVGRRALADYREKHDILKRLGGSLTTALSGIEDKIERLRADELDHRKARDKMAKSFALFEAQKLVDAAVWHGSRRYIHCVSDEYDDSYAKVLASELKRHEGTVNLIATAAGAVVCNAADNVDVDFSIPIVERAKAMGGRGGGKGAFASVVLPTGSDVGEFVERAVADLKEMDPK